MRKPKKIKLKSILANKGLKEKQVANKHDKLFTTSQVEKSAELSEQIARHLIIIRLTRITVDIVLFLNLVILAVLPWVLSAIYKQPALFFQLETGGRLKGPELTVISDYPVDLPPSSYLFYLIFLYAAGVCTAWLLLEGHFILRRLELRNPFSQKQSASFSRMTLVLALLSSAFLVKVFVYNTLLTMFCAFVFLMLALIAKILADVFYQAFLVKTDQELTI